MPELTKLSARAEIPLLIAFADLTRLAVALGGEAETVAGLCGLGDLVLTCSSPQSRNMSVGLALGRGETLEEALAGKRSVAEDENAPLDLADAQILVARSLGFESWTQLTKHLDITP